MHMARDPGWWSAGVLATSLVILKIAAFRRSLKCPQDWQSSLEHGCWLVLC